ncbi:MAG TPA: acylphosphatase [Xanthobacteraceae bacterium]|nr:acylphosphatase [Xanthobacteraceae bacterium]
MSAARKVVHVVIRGRVQGVGFRMWTAHTAERFDLEGWVRNLRDGAVEAVFAGSPDKVDAMIESCRRGPIGAHVDHCDVREGGSELLGDRGPGERFSVLETG